MAKRVMIVAGTRPEAVKLAPVARALEKAPWARAEFVLTAQHRSLLDRALADFGLKAAADLHLMRPSQTPNALLGRALQALGPLIARRRPDIVVVQGDTTSALAGALAAFHEGVPVAHVEAGLRTFDLAQPFPEEANRVLIDELADLLFAPTPAAAANLASRRRGRVIVSGNTVVDAVRWMAGRPQTVSNPALARALAAGGPLIVATLHRRESFGAPMRRACEGLRAALERVPGARLVCPVHPNPEAGSAVRAALRHSRAALLAPLSYPDFVAALAACRLVVTDSGGVQEEAATLGKPTLVLRRLTERPEAVRSGTAAVVGLEKEAVERAAARLLVGGARYRRMARPTGAFGDGKAGERVAAGIRWFFGLGPRPADFRPS